MSAWTHPVETSVNTAESSPAVLTAAACTPGPATQEAAAVSLSSPLPNIEFAEIQLKMDWELAPAEMRVLLALMRNDWCSTEDLRHVVSGKPGGTTINAVNQHIYRLRHKISHIRESEIRTIFDKGYLMTHASRRYVLERLTERAMA